MAKLSRVDQKIFGDTGATTEFGKIGSDSAGAPETTKDLEQIQSLDQYHGGLYDLTSQLSEPPRAQDLNSLYLLITTQLRYLMQAGVPEWHTDAEYYAGASFVQGSDGNIYQALTGDNTTPNTGNDPVGDTTNWVALGLGVAQTWHNETANRIVGTTYTNTHDKPIAVYIEIVGNANLAFFVDDNKVGRYFTIISTSFEQSMLSIVPAGSTYCLNTYNSATFSVWKELY